MRNHALAALAAAALVPFAAPGTAHAAPDPTGVLCGYSTMTDPVNGWQVGEIDGGPVALVDDADPAKVYWGSITCTIQRERAHAADDLASLTGSTTPGVATVAGTVAFPTEPGDWLWLCTQVDIVDGPTLYYDSDWETWSTSPTVSCSTSIGSNPPPDPFPGSLVDEVTALATNILCPILALVIPPEGDLPGIWDCPPFDAS